MQTLIQRLSGVYLPWKTEKLRVCGEKEKKAKEMEATGVCGEEEKKAEKMEAKPRACIDNKFSTRVTRSATRSANST
jgi:hypothetical protein